MHFVESGGFELSTTLPIPEVAHGVDGATVRYGWVARGGRMGLTIRYELAAPVINSRPLPTVERDDCSGLMSRLWGFQRTDEPPLGFSVVKRTPTRNSARR